MRLLSLKKDLMTFPLMPTTELENKHNPWMASDCAGALQGTSAGTTWNDQKLQSVKAGSTQRSSHEVEFYRVELPI